MTGLGDFLVSIVVPIREKKNTKKCEDFRTIHLISQVAKMKLRVRNKTGLTNGYQKNNSDLEEGKE